MKPRNEIFARHILATRCQQPHETLDEFLQALKTLSKDCNFQSITASKYCEESIRDALITGSRSPSIRQRLLENNTLDWNTISDQARSLELAMRNSESYSSPPSSVNAAVPPVATVDMEQTLVALVIKCLYLFLLWKRQPPSFKMALFLTIRTNCITGRAF